MRRFWLHSLCLALAAYFVVAGSGVNIAHYCCEACAEHGMRMFSGSCCEEVHHNHQHHEHAVAHCCEHNAQTDHQHNACSLQRVSTDIPTCNQLHFDLSPNMIVCAIIPVHTNSYNNSCPCVTTFFATHAPPLLNSGRTILAQKSLLLI